MMETIKDYLVGLGFEVDQKEFHEAQKAIDGLGKLIQSSTAGMAKDFTIAATSITGALMAIAGGVTALVTHIAQADMEYQKFALHMWTSKETAKDLKVALDAMGESMENVAWIPELREQFFELQSEAGKMKTPADAGEQLKQFRALMFEITRFKQEVSYAMEWIGYYLGKYLAGPLGNVKQTLSDLNDKIVTKMPEWTQAVAKVLAMIINVGMAGVRFVKNLYDGFERFFDALPRGMKMAIAAILGVWAVLQMSPIGMTIAGIGFLLVLLEDFFGYIDGRESSQTMAPIWQKLIDWFNTAELTIDSISGGLSDFWELLERSGVISGGLKAISTGFEVIKDVVKNLWQNLKWLYGIFKDIFDELLETGALESVLELFAALLTTVSNLVLGAINLGKHMREFWKEAAGNKAVKTLWNWFKSTLSFTVNMLALLGKGFLGLFDMIGLGMQGKFKEAAERGKKIFTDMSKDADRAVKSVGGPVDGTTTEKIRKSIGINESGNNPNAYNAAGEAYGKYQFQQGTWDAEARRAGRPDLVGVQPNQASEADQDAVAQKYVDRLFAKYGDPEKVAAVWYAGEGYVDGWAAGNPEYDPDTPMDKNSMLVTSSKSDGVPVYPSVRQYAKNMLETMRDYSNSETRVASAEDCKGTNGGSGSDLFSAKDQVNQKNSQPIVQQQDTGGLVYLQNALQSVLAMAQQVAIAPTSLYATQQVPVAGGNYAPSVGNINVYVQGSNASPNDIGVAVRNEVQGLLGNSSALQMRDLSGVIR